MDRKYNMVSAFCNAYQFVTDMDLATQAGKVVYIAGPMSGYEGHNAPAFIAEAEHQREMGFVVISPLEKMAGKVFTASSAGTSWQGGDEYKVLLIEDLMLIATCVDRVVLLPGWQGSKGACAEVAMAVAMKIPIYSSSKAVIPHDSIDVRLTFTEGLQR